MFEAMTRCAGVTDEDVRLTNLDAQTAAASRRLDHLLTATLGGEALGVQQRPPRGEGLVMWRQLVMEHEPSYPASLLARMRRLMRWTFSVATLERDLSEFDTAVGIIEQTGTRIPADVKAAVLKAGTQDHELQRWLMTNVERPTDYEETKHRART